MWRIKCLTEQFGLLIVPYGIETYFAVALLNERLLLIVPYGIETTATPSRCRRPVLLIVPYGIETPLRMIMLLLP